MTEINEGIKRALGGFITEPTNDEAKNAIYSAIAVILEVACRRLIAENLKVEYQGNSAVVTLDGPLAHTIRDLLGGPDKVGAFFETYQIKLTVDKSSVQPVEGTRPYIDPHTNRPTRGRMF